VAQETVYQAAALHPVIVLLPILIVIINTVISPQIQATISLLLIIIFVIPAQEIALLDVAHHLDHVRQPLQLATIHIVIITQITIITFLEVLHTTIHIAILLLTTVPLDVAHILDLVLTHHQLVTIDTVIITQIHITTFQVLQTTTITLTVYQQQEVVRLVAAHILVIVQIHHQHATINIVIFLQTTITTTQEIIHITIITIS
jgi:hypothetical protein